MKQRILIYFLLTILASNCIDPYHLELEEYESLLVVEGMITDELASYTIKLSRTFQNEDFPPVRVAHAEVSVHDEMGVIALFHELESGIYKSDSTQFTSRVGGTYTLHIKTGDGLEYASDGCTMTAVPEIDSIYYEVDSEFFDHGTIEEKGIRIYLDAGNRDEACQYFRWEYEEVWKFFVPHPVEDRYLGPHEYESIPVENHLCWGHNLSKEILIHSAAEQNSDRISREPIHFIASGRSHRLQWQYHIQVRQYSISWQEFLSWKNLREVTESGGDIFEKQPYPVVGNIRCINNEQEMVLGNFQVSAAKSVEMYISHSQINELDIPSYEYPCKIIPVSRENMYDLSYRVLLNKGYQFYNYGIFSPWDEPSFYAFLFTSPECADCSLTGNPEQPDFWVDMD